MLIINSAFVRIFNQVIPDINWSPTSVFANSEQGVWYDPSDISTLFQDSAGTTPVTATGQPVGRILDKSGRGNHATQATSTKRPTYQVDAYGFPYLLFDGVDDSLTSASIVPGVDKVQLVAGIRKLSDVNRGMLAEYTATPSLNSFSLWAPNSSLSEYSWISRGSSAVTINSPATYKAPTTNVVSGIGDVSGTTSFLRINNNPAAQSYASQGTGNFSTASIYVGSRGGVSNFFNGRIYGFVTRFGPNLKNSDLTSLEDWLNSKTGAY